MRLNACPLLSEINLSWAITMATSKRSKEATVKPRRCFTRVSKSYGKTANQRSVLKFPRKRRTARDKYRGKQLKVIGFDSVCKTSK